MKEIAYEDYRIYTESSTLFNEMQQALGQAVKDYAATLDNRIIKALEIGPGFGDTTIQILRADLRIILDSMDSDPEMLDATKERLEQEGIDPIRYQLHEGDTLLYLNADFRFGNNHSEYFDIFASAQTIHNFPNSGKLCKKTLYEDIAGILKPGGLFVLADKCSYGDNTEFRKALAKKMTQFAEYALSRKDKGIFRGYIEFISGIDTRTRSQRVRDQKEKNRKSVEEWFKHLLLDYEPHRLMHEETTYRELEEVGFTDIKTPWRKDTAAVITALKGGN